MNRPRYSLPAPLVAELDQLAAAMLEQADSPAGQLEDVTRSGELDPALVIGWWVIEAERARSRQPLGNLRPVGKGR